MISNMRLIVSKYWLNLSYCQIGTISNCNIIKYPNKYYLMDRLRSVVFFVCNDLSLFVMIYIYLHLRFTYKLNSV